MLFTHMSIFKSVVKHEVTFPTITQTLTVICFIFTILIALKL